MAHKHIIGYSVPESWR